MAHNLRNVLDTADRLRHRPDIRILLVGDGAEREDLVAEAGRRRLDNLMMQGPQPKEAMPRIWSLCDVALVHLKDSPVFAEVIPSKIFEAMGMGKPILLASPRGEASDILEADNAGLWVKPGDPVALAEAMIRLKDDDTLRAGLAAASLAGAQRHTRRSQAEEMLQALEIAAAGWGRRAGRDFTLPDGYSTPAG
jgi:glycosyltransferase involved in cell wall biosynthesis